MRYQKCLAHNAKVQRSRSISMPQKLLLHPRVWGYRLRKIEKELFGIADWDARKQKKWKGCCEWIVAKHHKKRIFKSIRASTHYRSCKAKHSTCNARKCHHQCILEFFFLGQEMFIRSPAIEGKKRELGSKVAHECYARAILERAHNKPCRGNARGPGIANTTSAHTAREAKRIIP